MLEGYLPAIGWLFDTDTFFYLNVRHNNCFSNVYNDIIMHRHIKLLYQILLLNNKRGKLSKIKSRINSRIIYN